jgi:long-chain acyl-CoA synthetase
VADKLVFAKIKQKLGGRLRVGVSGAAPLGMDVLEFFHSLGMLVIEGYGLTETASSLSVNDPDDFRFGTVGRVVEGTEVRLDEDGEILVRSDTVFAGYFKDPEATAAAFTDDGWFRTGDVGEVDADGFLKITDRKKDLIITAGGKNIAPQNLENALKASRFVSQALVVGDRRPYIVALITLDPAEIAAAGREPHELVQEIVDEVNKDRVRVEQVKRFAILQRDFTQEDGEVTPTLKLRRKIVHEHFADEIESLYSGDRPGGNDDVGSVPRVSDAEASPG